MASLINSSTTNSVISPTLSQMSSTTTNKAVFLAAPPPLVPPNRGSSNSNNQNNQKSSINFGGRSSINIANTETAINSSYEIHWKDVSIEKEIGRGSFGVVYFANYHFQPVAVKEMQNPTPETIQEFIKEATVWSQVKHHRVILVTSSSWKKIINSNKKIS